MHHARESDRYQKKLQTISDWPVPKNAKHVRSFLGLCCFYHQFFPQFATIASPLTAITGKIIWHGGATEQRAFEDLKESFLRHVVLAFPDRNKPYILYTDASDTGVGAMLCQEDDENDYASWFVCLGSSTSTKSTTPSTRKNS